MTAKKSELKTSTRKQWHAQLKKLTEEYPLVLHTDAGRTFSMVRRMKAEREMGFPINLRSGFAVSTANGKWANAMTENEWEKFYYALSEHLRRDYPVLYHILFSPSRPRERT
jgi:hypothetical protein